MSVFCRREGVAGRDALFGPLLNSVLTIKGTENILKTVAMTICNLIILIHLLVNDKIWYGYMTRYSSILFVFY